MPTSKKIFTVQNLTEKLKQAKGLILFNYQGLDVSQMTNLRQEVKKAEGEFEVVKNTLLQLAIKEDPASVRQLAELQGPTAALWVYKDNLAPIKAVFDFIKSNDLPKIKLGFWGKDLLSSEQIKELASLPGVEVLRAKLIGTLQSPTCRLVNSLRWNIAKLIYILKAKKDKGGD